VLADVVWPALDLESRLVTVSVFLGLSTWRSLLATFVMNAVSTAVGIVLLPVLGFLWEVGPARAVHSTTGMGTYNPVTWGVTAVLAVLSNGGIEGIVLRAVFKVPMNGKRVAVLLLANAFSVGLALVSLHRYPVQH
jgi:hypothetical protein